MGSIAGPIISFRFNAPSAQQAAKQLSNVVGSTMAKASKSSANQFVSDWQAAAAKLRAQLTSEKLGLNQITAAREKIIALTQRDLALQMKKTTLTKSDAAAMRAMTMEIERQKNALEGFGAMTSPTRKIIQQMISGIGMRMGSYGGSYGSFAGLRVNESLGKMADEATGGRLALLGVGAAAVVVTAAMIDMAKHGAEMAVSIRNASEAAGISVKSMVELQSASRTLGIDSDVAVKMFRKFNQELTYAMGASMPHASIETKRAAEVFQLLGVNIQKAAADPMEGFRELSVALSQLPDGAVKSATEVMLLGRGGQDAAPLINHLSKAMSDTKDSADSLASKIGKAADAGDQLETATVNLSNKWKELEVNLATVFVPLLSGIIGMINTPFNAVSKFLPPLPGATRTQYDIHGNPITVPPAIPSAASIALAKGIGLNVMLGKNPGSIQPVNVITELAQKEDNDSTASGKAAKAHKKLGESLDELMRHYEEATKKMSKENSANFAGLLFQIYMGGQAGADMSPDKTGAGIKDLMQSIAQEAKDTAQKIRDANVKAAQDIVDAWRNWRDEGKSLFEDLLSGGQNFAKNFLRQIEDIALKPVQNAFGNIIGNILYELDKIVPNSIGGSTSGGKSSGGWLGKIWQGIGKVTQPPKSVQQAMETIQNAQITATNVYITGPNIYSPPRPGASSFTDGGLLGLLSGNNNFSATASSSGLLGLLAGNNIPANVYSGGLLSLIGGTAASTAATSTGASTNPASLFGSYQGNGNGTSVGGALLQTLGAAIPGGALLGAGLYERGTSKRSPASIAMGAGLAAQGVLGTLSKLSGGSGANSLSAILQNKETTVNNARGLGGFLSLAGTLAGGIGQIVAGSQTKGVGGVLQGAMGGMQAGSIFGPIGAGVGAAIGGLISGIFGGGSAAAHAAAWQTNVNRAMNNQRVTLPPSETYAFASGNSMASIFSNTFGQGPGGTFTKAGLAANTPFWANAIYGTPRNTNAQIAFNNMMNGINPNSPFYGGAPNPFTLNPNQLPSGLRGTSGLPAGMYSQNSSASTAAPSSSVQVHFNFPGMLDANSAGALLKANSGIISKVANKAVYQQSSGVRRGISRAVNLP